MISTMKNYVPLIIMNFKRAWQECLLDDKDLEAYVKEDINRITCYVLMDGDWLTTAKQLGMYPFSEPK